MHPVEAPVGEADRVDVAFDHLDLRPAGGSVTGLQQRRLVAVQPDDPTVAAHGVGEGTQVRAGPQPRSSTASPARIASALTARSL